MWTQCIAEDVLCELKCDGVREQSDPARMGRTDDKSLVYIYLIFNLLYFISSSWLEQHYLLQMVVCLH